MRSTISSKSLRTLPTLNSKRARSPGPFKHAAKPDIARLRIPRPCRAARRHFRLRQRKALQAQEIVHANGESQWTLAAGWHMIPAPRINADGAAISQAAFNDRDWMSATVPGTVLTTMIDRGIYPDPDYGLNNLAIPESSQ